MITFGSLFSGLGGLDLGLEKAGFKCQWQVELNDFCRRVLQKHWPAIPRYSDIRDFGGYKLHAVDLIALGFPCTDISVAGLHKGIDGEHSGLWSEARRVISQLRPRLVIVENVAYLLRPTRHDGRVVAPAPISRVLGDLAALGYDAEWDCLPAYVFGADHLRDRTFIIAYPSSERWERVLRPDQVECAPPIFAQRTYAALDASSNLVHRIEARLGESSILRTPDGVSDFVERLGGIGNAVHVDVAEWIGKQISEALKNRDRTFSQSQNS